MSKVLVSALIFFASLAVTAQERSEDIPLDDLMSPDEIAEEMGFPRTEYSEVEINSVQELYNIQGMDVTREYPLVLFINKDSSGSNAQRMKIIENGVHIGTWKVSTGRERREVAKSGKKYFSSTPVGWFTPYTLKRDHYSKTWQAPMPFSIFFNGGIAIHATTRGHYRELGSRASGGCVRLTRDNAETLFEKVSKAGRGLVPVVRRNGSIARDSSGNVIREVKWRTLIVVQKSR